MGHIKEPTDHHKEARTVQKSLRTKAESQRFWMCVRLQRICPAGLKEPDVWLAIKRPNVSRETVQQSRPYQQVQRTLAIHDEVEGTLDNGSRYLV